ncbi:hypothetical protein AURDEDRAFT_159404 [Auricularia subglabra TFB-10046 SS5]|nr:hypothetical protein AURDEDRAFT_159404 [Auricularia subglabra TFB-10046 SS5]
MTTTDPIRDNHALLFATAATFSDLLQTAAEGHALWHPTTDGKIGDCGIISGGQFGKVYNVYERSNNPLPPLPRPELTDYKDLIHASNSRPLCAAKIVTENAEKTAAIDAKAASGSS